MEMTWYIWSQIYLLNGTKSCAQDGYAQDENKFDMMTSSAYQELKERLWFDGSFSSGLNLIYLLFLS
jgi:hypothetical protein